MRLVTMQILQEETGIPMTIISNSFQVYSRGQKESVDTLIVPVPKIHRSSLIWTQPRYPQWIFYTTR